MLIPPTTHIKDFPCIIGSEQIPNFKKLYSQNLPFWGVKDIKFLTGVGTSINVLIIKSAHRERKTESRTSMM